MLKQKSLLSNVIFLEFLFFFSLLHGSSADAMEDCREKFFSVCSFKIFQLSKKLFFENALYTVKN